MSEDIQLKTITVNIDDRRQSRVDTTKKLIRHKPNSSSLFDALINQDVDRQPHEDRKLNPIDEQNQPELIQKIFPEEDYQQVQYDKIFRKQMLMFSFYVLCCSFLAPLCIIIDSPYPLMKIVWRQIILLIFMLPYLLYANRKRLKFKVSVLYSNYLIRSPLKMFIISMCAVCQSIYLGILVTSIAYKSLIICQILLNLYPAINILIYSIKDCKITFLQICGFLIIGVTLILILNDSTSFGFEWVLFFGALAQSIYSLCHNQLRKSTMYSSDIFFINLVSTVILILVSIYFEGSTFGSAFDVFGGNLIWRHILIVVFNAIPLVVLHYEVSFYKEDAIMEGGVSLVPGISSLLSVFLGLPNHIGGFEVIYIIGTVLGQLVLSKGKKASDIADVVMHKSTLKKSQIELQDIGDAKAMQRQNTLNNDAENIKNQFAFEEELRRKD